MAIVTRTPQPAAGTNKGRAFCQPLEDAALSCHQALGIGRDTTVARVSKNTTQHWRVIKLLAVAQVDYEEYSTSISFSIFGHRRFERVTWTMTVIEYIIRQHQLNNTSGKSAQKRGHFLPHCTESQHPIITSCGSADSTWASTSQVRQVIYQSIKETIQTTEWNLQSNW